MYQGGRRVKRQDYHKKSYQNPLYRNKKRAGHGFSINFKLPKINVKASFVVLLFVVIFASIFWFILLSPVFLIKTVNVTVPAKISADDVRSLIWQQADQKKFYISEHNLLLFDVKNLASTLQGHYTVNNLLIKKQWPSKLTVSFEEKIYQVLWKEAGQNYFVSPEDGAALLVDLNQFKDKHLPVIENIGAARIQNGKISEVDSVNFTLGLLTKISNNSKYPIEKIQVSNQLNLLELKVQGGPTVRFDDKGDLDKQLEKLYNVVNVRLKDDFNKKTYIDVRFGDMVYIK